MKHTHTIIVPCETTEGPLPYTQKQAYSKGMMATSLRKYIGIDEAGRGPWAGPVVAAAVVLNAKQPWTLFQDSKALSAKARAKAWEAIQVHHAYGVGMVHPHDIDRLNILQATFLAMERAVENLQERVGVVPCAVRIDGNQIPSWAKEAPWDARALVGGDATDAGIAAASIVAKEVRDSLMRQMAAIWPEYGFEKHVGYGVPQHSDALVRVGPCPIHRRSYAPIRRLLDKA